MATIINMGAGTIPPVLLASVANVPTSSTAVSGTKTWKKYDAIYFECFMHYTKTSDKSVLTNLILTNNVSAGDRYQILRVSASDGNGSEINVHCYFSENAINIYKSGVTFEVIKLNIYGVNF